MKKYIVLFSVLFATSLTFAHTIDSQQVATNK